ncbi:hypothetical protein QYE76_069486 [Lolium multiflorum]|uniref:Lecithin-cholesterol acyltransferase-like 1 n=1 Tax=Lolium multiflorum TaxID=4521 RepID=A0AAD8SGE2_LOLMU|nr:hypothetical protein QYE76_069486 [Lolium multiflorum]
MAIHTPLLRLLPLLLMLLPSPLRDYLSPARHELGGHGQLEARHPIIIFPGFSCSNLEARLTDDYTPSLPHCGALKGKGWFPLSTNPWDLVDHDYIPCFEEQMSLVYDPVLNDYRNRPGVETRVPNFGSAYGFSIKIDGATEYCFIKLNKKLEVLGYRDGDTLFGAPYDIRHAPPLPGQPSEVYSDYFGRVKDLVQHASEKNGNKRVILVGHSFGGMIAQEFVNSTTQEWRNKFIKHMVLIAPTPPTGLTEVVTNLASGPTVIILPKVTAIALRPMWRTFASSILSMPSPWVFGDKPLIITKHRNYTAYDYSDFLTALGFSNGLMPFMKRVLPKMKRIDAPMVPTTYLSGIGVQTPEQEVYMDGNFDVAPEHVYGDGDGSINLVSMLAFANELHRQHLESNIYFNFIKIEHATHSGIIVSDDSLKIVIAEIVRANW